MVETLATANEDYTRCADQLVVVEKEKNILVNINCELKRQVEELKIEKQVFLSRINELTEQLAEKTANEKQKIEPQ